MAAPMAWYLVNQWLQGFAYRIEVQHTSFRSLRRWQL
jgi:hypothetical protein